MGNLNNMRITFTLAILSSLLTFNLNGQTWAINGAQWHYGFNLGITQNPTYIRVVSAGDTLINNRTCKKINWSFPYWTAPRTEVTYEDSGKIYWLNSSIDTFTILYDFNALPGNSWRIDLNDSCFTTIHVDSISTISINNDTLKVFHITDSSYSLGNTIIEHIGSTELLLPNLHPYDGFIESYCTSLAIDEGYPLGLRCYEDSIIGLYETHIASSCTYSTVGIDETQSEKFTIFPNPTSGELKFNFIPLDLEKIELLDVTGHLIRTFDNLETANLWGVTKGVYFLKITDSTGKFSVNKVINYP